MPGKAARVSPDATASERVLPGGPASERDGIDMLIRVLEALRKLDPDMPIQYALSFLTLAQNEGMSMGELSARLGIAQSSASRNVAALSRWHSFGKPGHDLVVAEEDPRERRRKLVRLTEKGHALIEELRALAAPEPRRPVKAARSA